MRPGVELLGEHLDLFSSKSAKVSMDWSTKSKSSYAFKEKRGDWLTMICLQPQVYPWFVFLSHSLTGATVETTFFFG